MSNCTDIDSYIITCRDFDYYNYYFAEVLGHSLNVTIVHDVDINENYRSVFSCSVQGNNSAGQGSSGYEYYGRELIAACIHDFLWTLYS